MRRARNSIVSDLINAAFNRLQCGDKEAIQDIIRLGNPFIQNIALRILRDRHDADEAVSSTWFRVWRKWSTFNGVSAFTSWLHRVATNEALMILRQRKRVGDQKAELRYSYISMEETRRRCDPEESYMATEAAERGVTILENMTEAKRSAFVRRFLIGEWDGQILPKAAKSASRRAVIIFKRGINNGLATWANNEDREERMLVNSHN